MKNRIGIVGGGQLARMLAFDAQKMGFSVTVLDPNPHAPGSQVADKHIVAPLSSKKAMESLVKHADFLTLEWELADDRLLDRFQKRGIPVNPAPSTLRIIKDKLLQKQFLKSRGIPVGDFVQVKNKDDVRNCAKKFGLPLLLKARTDAYDGRENALVSGEKEIDQAWKKMQGREVYVERYVPFIKELSVMVARDMKGNVAVYPVAGNIHKDNILHTSVVPARISSRIKEKAVTLAKKTVQTLSGAGVFGIEMFLDKKGNILVNEIAPRVHNSGHYTIEGCITSQFEQHIRAVTGLPLGSIEMKVDAVCMVNVLGERDGVAHVEGLEKALQIPNVTVHIYGKSEVRVGRKMGHITVVGRSVDEVLRKATKAKKMIAI